MTAGIQPGQNAKCRRNYNSLDIIPFCSVIALTAKIMIPSEIEAAPTRYMLLALLTLFTLLTWLASWLSLLTLFILFKLHVCIYAYMYIYKVRKG